MEPQRGGNEKSRFTEKRSFFNDDPGNLYKLINSVSGKLFDPHPFKYLKTEPIKNYAQQLVKEGITERAVSKILIDSFESDSIILDIIGENHEVSKQGEAIYKGYTKAIEALEKAAGEKVIVNDKSYDGSEAIEIIEKRKTTLKKDTLRLTH